MERSLGISNFLEEISAVAAKSLQSCLTLCDPIDGSPPGSPVPGILQARTLEWVAISFSNAWKWKVKVKSLSHVWPHGLQPTRLLWPWDFPGKSTGVGCHCLLVFRILLFSSISLHWSLRKAFLSLLVILWNSAFRWVYLYFSSFASLLFFSHLFVRPLQTAILLFLHFFFLGMALFPVSCTMSWTSVHSSSDLPIRSSSLNLFLISPV